jgi:hypothetical protein
MNVLRAALGCMMLHTVWCLEEHGNEEDDGRGMVELCYLLARADRPSWHELGACCSSRACNTPAVHHS